MNSQTNKLLTFVLLVLLFKPHLAKAQNLVETPQTFVKDQGVWSDCWIYASIALIESLYLTKLQKEYDFSENILAFQLYKNKLTENMSLPKEKNFHDLDFYVEQLIADQVIPAHYGSYFVNNTGRSLNTIYTELKSVAKYISSNSYKDSGLSTSALLSISRLGLTLEDGSTRADTTSIKQMADKTFADVKKYEKKLYHLHNLGEEISSFLFDAKIQMSLARMRRYLNRTNADELNDETFQKYGKIFDESIAPAMKEMANLINEIPITYITKLKDQFLQGLQKTWTELDPSTQYAPHFNPYKELGLSKLHIFNLSDTENEFQVNQISVNLDDNDFEANPKNLSLFETLKTYIITKKTPVIFNYYHCADYFDKKSGYYELPNGLESISQDCKIGGGHAVLITGLELDDKGNVRVLKAKNSSGTSVGDAGYIYFKAEQLPSLYKQMSTVE